MEDRLQWLEDPEVFRVGRLDAHSDHDFYESAEDFEEHADRLRQCLNGTWKFHWSCCPKERPADFHKKGYDDSDFDTIVVPGHIEMQGYDRIHYTNTIYPWEGHTHLRPPQIDWNYDPVGSYVLNFDVDEALRGHRICISFQGVEQAMYLWLNGTFIGYAEDTFTPSEFDLTSVIKDTDNRLCVEVYKRSSAAWIEDQDFFRFSGIFRDVYLYAKPKIHVEDMWAKASLKDDYKTGTLQLELKLSKANRKKTDLLETLPRGVKVHLALLCKHGHEHLSEDLELTYGDGAFHSKGFELDNIKVWDHEHPHLYTAVVTLRDAKDEIIEIATTRIGFRRFEMIDKIMCLNGKRIVIEGVNRHEWSADSGRVITKADMERDIGIFERNNISAVRTCHYPDQTYWYKLCDEHGIYVMDETNMESHGSWQKLGQPEPSWNVPGSRPEWKACVVDRATSMLERDKNHPSILWWSCGNESYAGSDIMAMTEFFHERDASRIVHYEGVFWCREFDDISDVESRMYATPWDIREYLENDPKKPFINCEYMHDMGNSLGGMESYVTLADEFPMYQGGFIWDYQDQALYYTDVNGQCVLGYGGDWSDRPSDYNFSGNGIVFANRDEKPAMQEVRFWHQPKAARDEQLAAKDAWYKAESAKIAAQAKLVKGVELYSTVDDGQVGVKGDGFAMMFGYAEGGPTSIVYDGCEWMFRAMRPALWRATTENDKGCGYPSAAAQWMGADMFLKLTGIDKKVAKDSVKMVYTFETPTNPSTTIITTYTIDGEGNVLVECTYKGKKGLPGLPLVGMRFMSDRPVDRFTWTGLSGETYPDRKKGGLVGVHEDRPHETPYLVPQENGGHTDTLEATLIRDACCGPKKLHLLSVDKPFFFSAVPHTPLELEAAMHQEELPRSKRTTVTIAGAMRGVGGIDTWMTDVEEAYRIPSDKDISFKFMIKRR